MPQNLPFRVAPFPAENGQRQSFQDNLLMAGNTELSLNDKRKRRPRNPRPPHVNVPNYHWKRSSAATAPWSDDHNPKRGGYVFEDTLSPRTRTASLSSVSCLRIPRRFADPEQTSCSIDPQVDGSSPRTPRSAACIRCSARVQPVASASHM